MAEASPSSQSALAKTALCLAGAALVFFVIGLAVGGIDPHRPGEETGDTIALILCRIVSPLLAVAAWSTGFAAVLKHASGRAWSAICVMLLILMFLALLYYSAWRGTAAFHPNTP